MKSKCIETGLPEPEITSHNGNVIVVFRFDKMLNGQPIENNGTLNESQRETFEYIRVNEGCNTTAIAKGIGKPFRTIDKHINILLQLGLIERR
jgi:predicted HTH transcriptional regulator